VTGQLVAPGSIGGFSDALAAYCTDDALRHAHAAAAQAATDRYDWGRINQVLIDIYLGLVRK
jgi:phosphatidylinositol alpha 1,6-mannosyltransferase